MSELLGTLYHWSPRSRRTELLREGLLPYSRPVCHSGTVALDPAKPEEQVTLSYPYVCLGPSPRLAWGLSGDTLEDDFDGWDLWEVRLPERANTHVLAQWGAVIREVRVRGAIAADYLWYVGSRNPPSAEEARP